MGAYDTVPRGEFGQFLPLGQFRFCIAMGKNHRLAGRRRLSLSDLHGERLMMRPGNSPSNDKSGAKVSSP